MEAETIVEEIRTDAAVQAANQVADTTAGATLVLASEVAAVESTLESHAETSEERHEEILGDTEWIKTQLEQLSLSLVTLQTSIAALHTLVMTEFAAMRTPPESTVTQPSNPEPEVVIAVVEPEGADGHQEARTEAEPAKPAKRRRAI